MDAARASRKMDIERIGGAKAVNQTPSPDEVFVFEGACPQLVELLDALRSRSGAGTIGITGLDKDGREEVHRYCHHSGLGHVTRRMDMGEWKGQKVLCVSWKAFTHCSEKLCGDRVEATKATLIRHRWRKSKENDALRTTLALKAEPAARTKIAWTVSPAQSAPTGRALPAPHALPACPRDRHSSCVVWLREDMRLTDNPALRHAALHYASVVPVYIHDPDDPSPYPLQGAGLFWKYRSLQTFASTLSLLGSRLVFRSGRPEEVLQNILASFPEGAKAVVFNRRCEPWYADQDAAVTARLGASMDIKVQTFPGNVLFEPWLARADERWHELKAREKAEGGQHGSSGAGGYHVPGNDSKGSKGQWKLRGFGSVGFWGFAIQELGEPAQPEPKVDSMPPCPASVDGLRVEELGYHRTEGRGVRTDFVQFNESRSESSREGDWAADLREWWQPGEDAANGRLRVFLKQALSNGGFEGRERLRADKLNTAVISPYVRFGELSARTVYWTARGTKALTWKHFAGEPPAKGEQPTAHRANATFLRRFMWRDMAYWFLWKWPSLPDKPLRPQYAAQCWSGTSAQLRRWQRGQTGFPLVDAAMTQLWRVGWMPNYLRHVVGQFLIEYLDVHWREGRRWFDWTLVDADVAINSFMWQNGGHSGPDQWQFVLHPVHAAKACDPDGHYVRTWLPELAHLPAEYIHSPWEAPARILPADVSLGRRAYAERLVEDLRAARVSHARNVLKVRHDNPHLIARTGNEWLKLPDGTLVGLITRADFRANTIECICRQTPDHCRDTKHKPLNDFFNEALDGYDRLFHQQFS